MASLRLIENGMVFEVEYLQILPKKKPMWVNKLLYEDKIENSFNFTKDFLSGIGAPRSSVKTEKNVMKMGYEYIRMTKRYSIFNFPIQWSYPLLVVFDQFEEKMNQAGLTVRYRPRFSMEFLTWFENIDNLTLSEEGDLTESTECGTLGIIKASADIIANIIPGSDVTIPEDKKSLTKKDLWEDDNINPLSNLYSKELKPHHQISENFIFWLTDFGEVLIWVQDDNSLILSSQEGKYFTHFYRNVKVPIDQDSLDSYEFKFSIETIPPVTRSKRKMNCSYSLTEVIKNAQKFVANAKLSELNAQTSTLPEVINSQKKEEELYKSMPFEVIHQSKNGYGFFEAYKNKSIKVVFTDRTVLRINFGQDVAQILTKNAERVEVRLDRPNDFKDYVKIACEYYENVFTDPKTKLERMKESAMLNDIISFELEKSERMLMITSGKVPTDITNQSFSRQEPSLNMSMKDLNMNERPLAVSYVLNDSYNSNYSYFDIDEVSRKIQE